MKQDVFGKHGHFVTSPEICQIFGEVFSSCIFEFFLKISLQLIAVWLLHEWQRFGKIGPLRVVELGPGRGSLISDITRVLSKFKQTGDKVSLHLVEISSHLASVQAKTLCGQSSQWKENYSTYSATSKSGYPVTWYQALEQVPEEEGFTCYIANEFLDALPIHKFQVNINRKSRKKLFSFFSVSERF